MAKILDYKAMKRDRLRELIAERGILNDKGTPFKSRTLAGLIAALEADDEKKKVEREKIGKIAQQSPPRSPRRSPPRRQVVAARAASPPRRGRPATPPKTRSKAEQKRLDNNLLEAYQQGKMKEVAVLIREGADVNATDDNEGWTALMWAAYWESVGNVRTLIRTGADVNAADNNGWTALMAAVQMGHREIVKMLIKAGADVNASDNGGKTALMRAAKWGHDEIVKMLIVAGADPEMRNNRGKTARDYWKGGKNDFDRLVEEAEQEVAERRMVKAAR